MNKISKETSKIASVENGGLSLISRDIILSLLYFDIFKYPLTLKELVRHSSVFQLAENEISTQIEMLCEEGKIVQANNFLFLPSEEDLVDRRIKGNIKAKEYIHKAFRISKFISHFPFIKGIFLSGSISKGYAGEDADIDYFIITTPGRLWLARTLLIAYKKIVLFNSKKYFCLNYFIDTDHLEILDKNVFTATELTYLLPTYNKDLYTKLMESNSWTKAYQPNFMLVDQDIIPVNDVWAKRFLEGLFSGFLGDKLDDFFMKSNERFWKIKYRNTASKYNPSIRCMKHVSKIHPQNFQSRVLDLYESKIVAFENRFKISLR